MLRPLGLPLLIVWLMLVAACAVEQAPLPTMAALAPTLEPAPGPSATPVAPVLAAAPDRVTEPTPPATYTPAPSATSEPTPTPMAVCDTPGEMVERRYPSAVDGPERTYRLYLPPCYGQDGRAYPTLIMLHGLGLDQDQDTWDDLGLDEAANEAILSEALAPFIIVMPAGGWAAEHTSGGPGSFETVVIDALMPHVAAETCAWDDPAGWAVGGLSRGGYWALEIAFRHPEKFASVGGHSAALLDIGAGPELNPQYTALSRPLGDLRVYLDVGEADAAMLPNLTRLHEDMVAAGIAHEWHLNAGAHNADYWSGQVADYLAWYGEAWPRDRAAYPPCAVELVP